MENNQYFKIDSLKELDICIERYGSKWYSPKVELDRNRFSDNFTFIAKVKDQYFIQNKYFVKRYKLKEVHKPDFLLKVKANKLLNDFRSSRLRNLFKNLDSIERQFIIDRDKELQEEITKCEESLFKCCDELGMKVEITYKLKSSI